MTRVAVEALVEVALREAPPGLFSPSASSALRTRTGWVNPPAVGFEVRLRGSMDVDLGTLKLAPSHLPRCIDAIFFEWDHIGAGQLRTDPLVFYRFGTGIALDLAIGTIDELGHGRCRGPLSVLPAGAIVTDFGSLDARAPGWARVGLLVTLDDARWLHERAPWGTEASTLARLFDQLQPTHPAVRVQLDLDPIRFVGLELHADQSPRGDGWGELLELADAHGLCDPARRAAVESWPGNLPCKIEGLGWCALQRTISHVKVSRDAEGKVQAKAYVFAAAADLW